MSQKLSRWKSKQPVSAAHLNEVWDLELKRAGLPDDMIYRARGGPGEDYPIGARLGVVVAAGPSGEADYTDERHWVQDVLIQNDGTVDLYARILTENIDPVAAGDGGADIPAIHTVTNLAAWFGGSHDLQAGQLILYFIFTDAQPVDPSSHEPSGTPNPRYVTPGGDDGMGEFIGMDRKMVAQNQKGWDFDELHSEL